MGYEFKSYTHIKRDNCSDNWLLLWIYPADINKEHNKLVKIKIRSITCGHPLQIYFITRDNDNLRTYLLRKRYHSINKTYQRIPNSYYVYTT